MTLLLNTKEVEFLLKMRDCVEAMEYAFKDLAIGQGINRPRSHTYVPMPGDPDEDRFYMFKSMDGALTRYRMHGIRITSDMLSERLVDGKPRREKLAAAPGNKYAGLLILFSLDTLEPLAIMPDGYLQRMRVGATSAVAARYLAKSEVRLGGLIGTGWQAGAQLMGLVEAFRQLVRVKVYSLSRLHRTAFAAEWSQKLERAIEAVDTPDEAVRDADVVALATNAHAPVVDGDLIPEGCHVGSVQGAELDDKILARADVIVVRETSEPTFWVMGDKLPREVSSQKSIRKGDIDRTKVQQLGDIIAGKARGRTSDTEITLFTGSGSGGSAGLGTQFVAVGATIYRKARELSVGRELPTEWFLQEFKP